MHVEFLSDRKVVVRTIVDLLEQCTAAAWAVAWATEKNEVYAAALHHKAKFKQLLFGTQGWLTSPDAIAQMLSLPNFRVLEPNAQQLFHPKLYVFRIGDESVAIIGSHNLTYRAFNRNEESSVLIRGKREDPELQKVWRFISENHAKGRSPDTDWLFDYRHKFNMRNEAEKKLIATLKTNKTVKPSRSTDDAPSPYLLSWSAFVQRVVDEKLRGTGEHTIEGRLEVLEKAADILASAPTFADLSPEDRGRVAGTAHGEAAKKKGEPNWFWFGNMAVSPKFRKAIKEDAQELSDALAQIPATGPVDETHYLAFLAKYKSAKNPRAVASRLLAMKRPDQFVCVSIGNMKGIVEHINFAPDVTVKNYWELIELIRQTPWWQADRPSDVLGGRIWDGRAALLDALYYSPPPSANEVDEED